MAMSIKNVFFIWLPAKETKALPPVVKDGAVAPYPATTVAKSSAHNGAASTWRDTLSTQERRIVIECEVTPHLIRQPYPIHRPVMCFLLIAERLVILLLQFDQHRSPLAATTVSRRRRVTCHYRRPVTELPCTARAKCGHLCFQDFLGTRMLGSFGKPVYIRCRVDRG